MQTRRHALLYDVERWRRYRLPLAIFGTACLVATIVAPALHRNPAQLAGTQPVSLLGAAFYGFLLNFWLRQRYSNLSVEGENLVARRVGTTVRLPLARVRRARIARVSAIVNRPERRRVLPRPAARWLEEEALILRLDVDASDLVRLRRLLGRQYVFESDLVAPVADPQGLLHDIQENSPRPDPPAAASRRRRRR
jgi:hypothetical protein